jgi:hypothetical protein
MYWLGCSAAATARRLLFVSSSSVFAQKDGEWIDETASTEPEGYSGKVMLEAEQLALHSGIPASVVRLTGIYGPGREWLLSQVRQGYRVAEEPPLYGNRIHAEDAASLLAFLLQADAVAWRWTTVISVSTTTRRRWPMWWPGCGSTWALPNGPMSGCGVPAASAAAMRGRRRWAGCRSIRVTRKGMRRSCKSD